MTWLRSQRIALMALMFSAIAVAGVYLWLDVQPVTERNSVTIIAAHDGVAEIAGQELALESARWDEFSAPDGSRVLSIRMSASGGPDATTCGAATLSEPNGGRTWLDADDVIDVPYDSGLSRCTDESAPYGIISVFLVPDDADGPFVLDVPGERHVVARFVIEL